MRAIQQVPFPDGKTLYITGYDQGANILNFRMIHNFRDLQSEEIEIRGQMVYLEHYHFSLGYLLNFLELNDMLGIASGS